MAYHLYNIDTQQIIWANNSPYLVDGKPGVLPDNVIQLVDYVEAYPELPAGKDVQAYQEVNLETKQYVTKWKVVDMQLHKVTKLTIKNRVTAMEWAYFKNIIAAYASSNDTQEQSIAEDWNLATEVDPEDPRTQMILTYMQNNGLLLTPLYVIFAPVEA
jgi:hypothetical protein